MTRIGLAVLALIIVGCTTAPTDSGADGNLKGIAKLAGDPRLGEPVKRICFASRIDGFRSSTKDTIIVESGLKKEFILETMPGCNNLRNAQAIGLDTGFSCLSALDSLLVYDSSFGTQTTPFSQEKCAIKSIHRWNENADPVDLGGIRPEDVEPIMPPLK